MIQFNLLPDVKLEYIKARRSKRMVLLTATGVAGFALFVTVSLFIVVNVLQTKHINDLNTDIKTKTATLKEVPNLDKILTVQNQLNSLTSLHSQQKPATSRMFDYLTQLTPATATISTVKLDFDTNTITIAGNADTLATVNKYVDTLKFTTYTTTDSTTPTKAFSEVVLSAFSASSDKGATYEITAKFDPMIFDNTQQVKLTTPKITSTRSETEKPTDLFQQDTSKAGQ